MALALAAALAAAVARGGESAQTPDLDWREISEIGTEGQAWKGEKFPYPYARIPLKFKDNVTKNVWANSLTPTGMSATFETDSDQIWISREFLHGNPSPFWFGNSGFDLYAADKDGNFRWLATTPIARIKDNSKTYKLSSLLGGKPRMYRVYLPLRNILTSAKIGVKKGSSFKPAPQPAEKPLVFYGTSIVHGAWATHSGLSHPSAIGRMLKMPVVNLGFSGSAQMETGMAETLATIDAAIYVIDATQNMSEKLVRERCEKFLRRPARNRKKAPERGRQKPALHRRRMAVRKRRRSLARQLPPGRPRDESHGGKVCAGNRKNTEKIKRLPEPRPRAGLFAGPKTGRAK